MAVATEFNTAYTTKPAAQPGLSIGGHVDANLFLRDNSAAVTTTSNTTAIDVEGGSIGEVVVMMQTVTGTTPTVSAKVQASVDGGSTYFDLITLPTLDTNDGLINAPTTAKPVARLVYIPRPTGTNRLTKVRLAFTVTGTSPSFTGYWFLRDIGLGADNGLETLT